MDVISEVNSQADSGQVAHDERDAQKGKYMTFKSGNEYEKEVIAQALDYCGYNISRTAQTLGILRQSLQYRIRKYGLIF